ncbi:hypothetical protein AZI86_09175 [Bdellovibrio bacteriovorus]|uniref:Histidine phosphatase family protein n=1 Tax=Bdellovibrio bacteriovorus TaxID=959 RepID=A0A150WRN3_BDEBC|nr:histidine phosphatase family protein [Bdellovibrio bacteriovorus]KYG67171.1 hypothetical protein AZI86_09175 [Bdellovibrio bacteriovorus]
MIIRILSLCLLVLAFCNAGTAQAAPARIIILRHAEKVSDLEKNLSPEGYARAEALAKYFSSSGFLNTYGKPEIFFAASPKGNSSLRSVETVAPAAQVLKVPLDSSFDKDDGEDLMEYVLRNTKFDGKTVVICWNRKGIPDLLNPLEGDFPKRWSENVFDRFWILEQQADRSYYLTSIPQDLY